MSTKTKQTLYYGLVLLASALLMAACGGGGGSPGATGNGGGTAAPKVASVALVASAATIDSSGAAGAEVTLTAIVKDAGNNALSGQTVSFTASSGIISNTGRSTDGNGSVVEKLSVKDSAAPRAITITASAGGVTSAPVTVTVVVATPTLTLTSDSGTLASSGAAGTEVTLTAMVKDAGNNVVPGVAVALAADNNGNLAYTTRSTDANGKVTARLDTVGDPSTRVITVTASTSGAKSTTLPITVAGNRLVVNSSSTVKVGSATDVTVRLVDSAGNALAGKAVAYSSGANTLSVKGGGSAVTGSTGQLVLQYTAGAPGLDTIVVKAGGESASWPITVSATNFTVNAVDGGGAALATAHINTCQRVLVHDDVGGVPQSGSVVLAVSRGAAYSDAACTQAATTALALVNGNATGYVRATSPGVATLTAGVNGLSAQGVLEYVAPYTPSATVTVQADPAVLGVNQGGGTAQQATIRAIVLDGTAQNNLVKNAQVAFSIASDPSGGTLSQPSVLSTGADGTASVSYIAGASDTKLNGVVIQAQLQGASANSGSVQLTVAKKALFITAGTGNTVLSPDAATYQVDYAVFVTDAAGNPVSGVNLTSSVRPRHYYKGELYFNGSTGPWQVGSGALAPLACRNEDVNSDGILQPGEDVNGDNALTPGNAVTATSSATTDAKGQATVSLRYARDRANWLDVDLTIRGQVSGSEASYVAYAILPGLAADYISQAVTPPGRYSPYGRVADCTTTN